MERLVSFSRSFKVRKLGKALLVEGTALSEGLYTDQSGETVFYSRDIIEDACDSFLGVPFVFPHTREEEGGSKSLRKVCGFTSEIWMKDKEMKYRGYVYNPEAMDLLQEKVLDSNSIEAKLISTRERGAKHSKAQKLYGQAIAFTTKQLAACPSCAIEGHRTVTKIALEKRKGGKNQMSEEIVAEGEPQLEPQDLTPLEPTPKEPMTDKEFIDHLREMVQENYPAPKTKAWGDMTDAEKYQTCVLFFKHKKYPLPAAKPVKKTNVEGKEVWEFPKDFPAELIAEFEDGKKKVTDLQAEVQKLNSQIDTRDKKSVTEIVTRIKNADTEFNAEEFLKGIECPAEQVVMLEKYETNLDRLKPKFDLGEVAVPTDEKTRLNNIALEAFGTTIDELEKSIGNVSLKGVEVK